MKKTKNKERVDLRDVERRAEARSIHAEILAVTGPAAVTRRKPEEVRESVTILQPLPSAVPAPAAGPEREFKITLISRSREKDHVRIHARSLAEAKKHAVASFMASDTVIGVTVRPVKEESDAD